MNKVYKEFIKTPTTVINATVPSTILGYSPVRIQNLIDDLEQDGYLTPDTEFDCEIVRDALTVLLKIVEENT